jgi:signal transduction histidine kinase
MGQGPLGQPSGLPGLICVAVEDLTWTQDLRRELVLAKERLAKVMGAIGDAILTLDKTGLVQQANDATKTVLGVSPSDLYHTAGLDLAATPRARAQLVAMTEQLQHRGFAEVELRLLRRQGGASGPTLPGSSPPNERPQRFLARMSALHLCDETGASAGAVWRIQDLTELRRDAAERHRLRLRLVQSERLSALGEMAARIAHEVRNPMVSIGAAAQVVAEELPDSSPVRAEAQAICSEVRRLDHILSNVLRFARPPRAAAQRTDVVEVLRQVLDLRRGKASGLSIQLDPGLGTGSLFALIEPDQLKQVLWNLLLNACDAARTPAGATRSHAATPPPLTGRPPSAEPAGVVECAVRRRRPWPTRDARSAPRPEAAGSVLITIADSGPGIPPAVRRRVFDPFFSTKSRGTGLGLPISKQIIESAGGRIRLLNRPGGGTRVIVELNAAP